MADLVFRAQSQGDLLATQNFTVTKPTGTQSTDVLVLVVGNSATTVTPPAGWNIVASAAGDATIKAWVFWAYGSVANLTFTHPTSSDVGWVMVAYQNGDQTTQPDATGSTATNTNSGTLSAPAVTTATDRALELIGAVAWQSGAWSATGFTSRDNGSAANQQAALLEANSVKTPAGSTGAVTVTNGGTTSGQHLIVVPFALRPEAVAASTAERGLPYLPQGGKTIRSAPMGGWV